jgi:hypothetical protein
VRLGIRRDLSRLALVIAERGDEYPMAMVVRDKLLRLQEAIIRKGKGKIKT